MRSSIHVALGFLFLANLCVYAQEPSKGIAAKYSEVELTVEEFQEIEKVVDQLVFSKGKKSRKSVLKPGLSDQSSEYEQQFKTVEEAFEKLTLLKMKAFPVLVKHLDDKRPSINFRNHYVGHSIGDACTWNIYYQLQDRPKDYSTYGFQRKGRDGEYHTKPYWEGIPFDEAGGVSKWLEQNKELTYSQMQVKCLNWLLDAEKRIGSPDANSYFENILPLEIQILKRELESGLDVKERLAALEKALLARDASIIPPKLLPPK